MKRRNKIVQEITRNVTNVFSFYAIIAIKHGFFNALTFARSLRLQFSTPPRGPGEPRVLKNAAFSLGFQHLPGDLANVNA